MNISFPRTTLLTAGALVVALGLVGCSGTADAAPSSSTTSTAGASTGSASLSLADAWAKAAKIGDMTAAFGTLTNDGDTDITVTSAAVELAGAAVATDVELHETVMDASGTMTMRPVAGGFTVPAHGSLTLEPGGNHIMLMGLSADLVAGDDVTIILTLDDGSTVTLPAPVKDFTGANENYGGSEDMDGMDHGDHTTEPTP